MSHNHSDNNILDHLLISGKIDFFEHQTCEDFRRLYTKVNGSSSIRSSFPNMDYKRTTSSTEEEIVRYRTLYLDIMKKLEHHKNTILDICVFNILPNQNIKAAIRALTIL